VCVCVCVCVCVYVSAYLPYMVSGLFSKPTHAYVERETAHPVPTRGFL